MIKRIITAILLILVMAAGIWLQGWPLRIILLISMVVSLSEMYRAFRKIGYDPDNLTLLLFSHITRCAFKQ